MESAAALANTLRQMNHSATKPTDAQVEAELNEYQKILWDRFSTVDRISQMVTRRDAVDSMSRMVTGFILVKLPIDFAFTSAVNTIKSASLLDYLPLPDRTRQALAKQAANKSDWGVKGLLILCVSVPALFLFFWSKYY